MESRLTELEIRYTHLERQFVDLSDVVFEQQRHIDALMKELARLRGRMDELGESPANEKPPHY
jgi:uncharacterized coiled-coil protein SlyX